jgi:hypothetical protein
MFQRIAVLGLCLIAACGSSSSSSQTPPPVTGMDIPATVSGPLRANLAAQAQTLNGTAALAAQAAALALQAGVQAVPVTLSASEFGLPSPGGGGSEALSRSGALISGGSGSAFAFQLTVVQATGSQIYSGVVAYEGASDVAVVQGLSPGNAVPPGTGFILLENGSGLWVATAGQESAALATQSGPCSGNVPSYITACQNATFTNAGFAITASMLFSGGNGSQTASLPNTSLTGVALTLDCSQSTLCETSTPVSVSVSPATETVPESGTFQFYATVTGTTNTAVTWSVQEGSAGGTVSSGGLYTAPPTAGTYHVLAQSVADKTKTGSAVVTVSGSGSGPGFVAYWQGDYSLLEGSTQLMGTVTFAINGAANNILNIGYLCAFGNFVQATQSSPTTYPLTFTITSPQTCPFPSQTCATATLTFTGLTGTLSNAGVLNMTFAGTIDGLSGTACGVITDFSGTFGPGTTVTN